MASHDFDVLIVGSGLAGLSAALHLAPTHRVAVLTIDPSSTVSGSHASGAAPSGRGAACAPAVCTSRSSIATKSPDSGQSLHSASAVVWIITTCPPSSVRRVTRGVPSVSDASVRADSAGSGSGSSCARTVTSGGAGSPASSAADSA